MRRKSPAYAQERGKAQGDGRKNVFLLKEMCGGPMPGTLEKGESVAPKGRGNHEEGGRRGREPFASLVKKRDAHHI